MTLGIVGDAGNNFAKAQGQDERRKFSYFHNKYLSSTYYKAGPEVGEPDRCGFTLTQIACFHSS
jgi:hypothetical protein